MTEVFGDQANELVLAVAATIKRSIGDNFLIKDERVKGMKDHYAQTLISQNGLKESEVAAALEEMARGVMLQCPFCGDVYNGVSTEGIEAYVECCVCFARGPRCGPNVDPIDVWNRRPKGSK